VAAVPLDQGIAAFVPMTPQLRVRAFLVGTHQPAVSSHVGRQNGREVASNSRLFQISAPRTGNKILPISACPDQKRVSRCWPVSDLDRTLAEVCDLEQSGHRLCSEPTLYGQHSFMGHFVGEQARSE